MKIPLLIQANPFNLVSPVVFLPEGQYVLRGNHKEAKLSLITSKGRLPFADLDIFQCNGECVQVEIWDVQTGSNFSITAEKQ